MSQHRHCSHYVQLCKENVHLKQENMQLKSTNKEKDMEIDELKRRLQYYENPNSPPSTNSLLWKQQKKEKREERNRNGNNNEQKKPGRKDGHEGVTHSLKPSKQIKHRLKRCPKCGSRDLKNTCEDRRTIVEIPKPQPYTVTEHIISTYHCKRCNSEIRSSVDIPEQGMLGKNLLCMVTTLWSEARLPVRKIGNILKVTYDLKLCGACINAALLNVSDSLEVFVNMVRGNITRSKSAGRSLFTFVMHYVDSTNNAAERVLREVVIHRKIRGLLRNGKGMKMFGNIMTAVMTWKLRGLNPLEEMKRYL